MDDVTWVGRGADDGHGALSVQFSKKTQRILRVQFLNKFLHTGDIPQTFFFEELAGALLCHIRRRASKCFTVSYYIEN